MDAYSQELGARSPEEVTVESLPSIESTPSSGLAEGEQENSLASEPYVPYWTQYRTNTRMVVNRT